MPDPQLMDSLIVRLHIKKFNNTKQDKAITIATLAAHNLTEGAGKWSRSLINKEFLKEMRSMATTIRTSHNWLTLSWDDGTRLLTKAARVQYLEAAAKWKTSWAEVVENFIAAWPVAVAGAKAMHGETFRPEDYPDAAMIREAFALRIDYEPVPSTSALAEALTGEALNQMQQNLEAANTRRVAEAVEGVWKQILEPLQKMAEKLTDPEGVFRDTLIGNISDIASRIPLLNITGSTELAEAKENLDAIAAISPETLRTDPILRQATAEKAKQLVAQFGNLGGRKIILEVESESPAKEEDFEEATLAKITVI